MKKVNVKISGPIYSVKPPIQRNVMGIMLSPGDIRNCICSKAIVEEILDNGDVIRLDLYNYNKNNNPKKEKKQQKPETKINNKLEKIKKEEPVVNVNITNKPLHKAPTPIKKEAEARAEVKKEEQNTNSIEMAAKKIIKDNNTAKEKFEAQTKKEESSTEENKK